MLITTINEEPLYTRFTHFKYYFNTIEQLLKINKHKNGLKKF